MQMLNRLALKIDIQAAVPSPDLLFFLPFLCERVEPNTSAPKRRPLT